MNSNINIWKNVGVGIFLGTIIGSTIGMVIEITELLNPNRTILDETLIGGCVGAIRGVLMGEKKPLI